MWNVVFAEAQQAAQQAAPDGAADQAQPSPFGSMLPLMVAFFAIMYFLMIRPNQKKEKERRNMLAAVGKGDKVVTSGGICGTVVGLSEKTVVLRVSEEPNVKMEFLRGAISQVTSRGQDEK